MSLSPEMSTLIGLARRVKQRATALGADEVSVSVSRASHVTMRRRDRQTEQSTEATTRGLTLSVLVGDRFTSNATSDLREDALDAFLGRCVAAARWLEPDPKRRLADPSVVGRGVSESTLDQDDPAWTTRTPADREARAREIEEGILASGGVDRVTVVASVTDGRAESFRTATNGFEDGSAGTFFSSGGELVVMDGDKRPAGGADYTTRHLADQPTVERVVREAVQRTRWTVGSAPIPSGRYPMLLENRVAGRILGMLLGPISGGSLHERRSCMLDRKGTRIASPVLSIDDDPAIPRGLGSRPWDGDGVAAKGLPIVRDGVLENYYLSTYHSRKLDLPATTGGRSNWVLRSGTRPFATIARDLPRAISITSFLGGSSNAATGDFSMGIRGLLLERGEVVGHLSEMNVSGNLSTLLESLAEVGNDPWTWGAVRTPAMFWPEVQFSGS